MNSVHAIEIFFCYAPKDQSLCSELEKHLRIMQRQGLIIAWHDSLIRPGLEWEQETRLHLNKADIILLLISSDFIDSEQCYRLMKQALQRHDAKEAVVVPIILRPINWEDAPFNTLKCLPKDAKPVTLWRNRDAAFTDISHGIRHILKTLTSKNSIHGSKKSMYCPSCNVPASLPVFCFKCGFPAVIICNNCKSFNSIEREACHKCFSLLVLVCSYCKEKNAFEAEFCSRCGLQLQQICYECGERNPLDYDSCQRCGVSIIDICTNCNQKNEIWAESCLRCGLALTQICFTCGAFNDMEETTCWRCLASLNIPIEIKDQKWIY
ncbi:toll/interleukin-1 receptor domain-containing protein [Dictyobacter halimunensis]|uniref:toll/interleukin-1 receptor domain-containing protein n=1 Tax=Dictyobacter halimunensis TaxID=3026934 RepID=UPI0030C711A8